MCFLLNDTGNSIYYYEFKYENGKADFTCWRIRLVALNVVNWTLTKKKKKMFT